MPLSGHGPTFAGLNPLDWALVVLLGFSAVTAFLRGLIRSVVSLVGVAAGLIVAAWYAGPASVYVVRWVPQPALAEVVAFACIFATVFLLASLLGRILRSASQAVGLGFMDRLGGAAFGVVRAFLVIAAILVPAMPYLSEIPYARGSVLLPYLRTAAHGVSFVVPQDFGNRLATGVRQLEPGNPAVGRSFLPPDHRRTARPIENEGDRP